MLVDRIKLLLYPFVITDTMKASSIKIDKINCKGCGICIDVCPKKVIANSEEINEYGLFYPYIINLDNCIVCRLCELYCPDFAIDVEEKK